MGEISTGWVYGLLIGGGILLIAALGMVLAGRNRTTTVSTSESAGSALLWHGGIFLAVNAFLWIQDIAIGGGLEYAYWVTIPWAIGLAVHASAYFVSLRSD